MARHARAILPALAIAAVLLAAPAISAREKPAARPPDLAVINARLVDGSGKPAPAEPSAVLVIDGRIAAVGPMSRLGERARRARRVVDARGQVVAPGFIDVHTHAEGILRAPLAEHFVRQGVTTLIAGNCGSSKVDVGQFLREVDKRSPAPNVATLIGHGTVRGHVLGYADRRPRPRQLQQMERLVERAMRDGALGLSTGLIYAPGTYAELDEIVALARVAARHGGIYASHIRNESVHVLEAVEEALAVGRRARLPVHISHFKVSSKSGGVTSRHTVALVRAARARGMRVTADQYVYTASSTSLDALLPGWALAGGRTKQLQRLADPVTRAHLVREVVESYRKRGFTDLGFARIAHFGKNPKLEGLSLLDAAQQHLGKRQLSFERQVEHALELLRQGNANMVYHTMRERDVEHILAQPWVMFASDSAIQAYGRGRPHPRGYGNSVRVLARYVREKRRLALAEAVRRMTSLPAETFGLRDRGRLAKGHHADLVIFDPTTVADTATFEQPHSYPRGVSYVIVNGVVTVAEGKLTGERAGRALRRGI